RTSLLIGWPSDLLSRRLRDLMRDGCPTCCRVSTLTKTKTNVHLFFRFQGHSLEIKTKLLLFPGAPLEIKQIFPFQSHKMYLFSPFVRFHAEINAFLS